MSGRTQVERVADRLREAVLSGDLAPGERLREVELARAADVSRHTLRAALRQLAAQRLVVIEPHRGASVARLADDDLRALFDLRTALEVEAARLLRDRAGLAPWPDGVRAASATLEQACAAPDADPDAIEAAHAALHHALVAAAGSPRITAVHAGLALESRLVLVQSRPALPPARMAALHRDLLRDLRTVGPEALRAHLAGGAAAATGAPPDDPG